MKVLPFNIPKTENKTFIYQEDKAASFYDKLHAHEEIQVSLILKGSGELLVGDTIRNYKTGDVFVIGSNLPHLFRSDVTFGLSHMKTVFFTQKSLGNLAPELLSDKGLGDFLESCGRGIKVLTNDNEIKRLIQSLPLKKPLEELIAYLKITELLIQSDKELITNQISVKSYSERAGKRMGDVVNLAISEYSREITLAEVSGIANLSKNAFCRYFKAHTNKTFFEFLIEIRIENACKLLKKNKNMSILAISENCGFANISHFNRKFKALKKMTPNAYRLSN